MPYTNAWNESLPLGSADADTLDDIIRALKFDIRERINTVLKPTAAWDTGVGTPIELLPSLRTGVVINIPASEAQFDFSGGNAYVLIGPASPYVELVTGGVALAVSIPANNTWKITKIDVLSQRVAAGGSTTIRLNKTPFLVALGGTILVSTTVPSGGVKLTNLFTGAETVSDAMYTFELIITAGDTTRFYGLQVTYDETA